MGDPHSVPHEAAGKMLARLQAYLGLREAPAGQPLAGGLSFLPHGSLCLSVLRTWRLASSGQLIQRKEEVTMSFLT